MRRLAALLSMLVLPIAANAVPPAVADSQVIDETPSGHDGQVGAVGRAEVDVKTGNAGPAFGVAMGLGSRLELDALIVTEAQNGLRLAFAFFFRPEHDLKPFLRAGATFVGREGTRSGVHAGAGVVWDLASMLGIVADGAVEHFPDMPGAYQDTSLRVSVGLELRNPR